jgi:hypothetical protein
VRREFPQAQLLEARHLYASNAEWRRRWPAVLRRLTRLVFFADPDGWIGRGVWTEITDAAREGLPVFYLSDRGRLTPFASVRLGPPDDASWQRYCRVVPLARER